MIHQRTPHMLFLSHKVVDIKTPIDIPELARPIGLLREYLQAHSFIPGDKFTGEVRPVEIDRSGNLICELVGSSLGSNSPSVVPAIKLILPLGLTDFSGRMTIESIFHAIKNTSFDDGGNIQNMLLDTLMIIEALSHDHPEFNNDNLIITAASSSDPFEKIDNDLAKLFQKRIDLHRIGIKDRVAIHVPYDHSGGRGIMAITSEPTQLYEPIQKLHKENERFARAFGSATCIISSDPLFQLLPIFAFPPYAYIVNASTAFRGLVALNAYGHNALLPMNQKEAGEVCKLMLSRARGTELNQTETPRFPSPLTINEDRIDPDCLSTLDNSIDMFARHNPFFQREEGLSFACPISFGDEGGLIIGLNKGTIACFSSIPSPNGEQRLFEEYSFPKTEGIQETGAGDSVAAISALFNTVNPEMIIEPFLQGKEREHSELKHLAATIFVSCLGRIIGNILIRTPKTNLADIPIESLRSVIKSVAEESAKLAIKKLRMLPDPTFGVIDKWDIKVAMWSPRSLTIPQGATIST
jgi:hypothetical protein